MPESSTHRFAVITTIQQPTPSMLRLVEKLREASCPLLVIGDKKGPQDYPLPDSEFFSYEAQLKLPYRLAAQLPTGHYSRKNLGYLIANTRKAGMLYETDDDNAPLDSWSWRKPQVEVRQLAGSGWMNVYNLFSSELIWPRGLPLSHTRTTPQLEPVGSVRTVVSPIQQGLANGSPDVDAIWRLILDSNITFQNSGSVILSAGQWCPFNSQSTWWYSSVFPLLYLPSFCSFRMTDIWRSFIAQRCLWAFGSNVAFHNAEVFQERNVHDLMRDFEDEVSGYLQNDKIATLLNQLDLDKNPEAVGTNLLACYECLVANGIFPSQELPLVRSWLADLSD